MKDANKTIQNTIEEGGEEEPPLEVPDSEMDFDTSECSIHILTLGRSIFGQRTTLVWIPSGSDSIFNVHSLGRA